MAGGQTRRSVGSNGVATDATTSSYSSGGGSSDSYDNGKKGKKYHPHHPRRGGGTSGTGGSSNNVITTRLLPILVVVAFGFYLLGFLQSIRSLPDISSSDGGSGGSGNSSSSMGGGGAGAAARRRASKFGEKVLMPLVRRAASGGSKTSSTGGNGGLTTPEDRIRNGNNGSSSAKTTTNLRNTVSSEVTTRKMPQQHGVRTPPIPQWPPIPIENDFELIEHPADPKTKLNVPKFWSQPIMTPKGPLMSREVADSIGSCSNDSGGGSGGGDGGGGCNFDGRTIFLAIASYRDYQCRETVESIFSRARYPERVRVVVVDQIEEDDVHCGEPPEPCTINPNQVLCKYSSQIDVYTMEAKLAVGPVFARHIGHRMYRGEYYAMQIDAHVTFVTDWDMNVIEQHVATGNDMAVLSTYLTDIVGSIDPVTGKSLRNTRPIMCNTDYEGGIQGPHLRHLSQPERVAPIKGSPQLQPYWAAGWSFSRGHFVTNIPYDQYQPMIFQGEESSIGIRAFTYGYDHYAPERSICFHTYANGANQQKRNKVPKFWDHGSLYKGTGVMAMKRLLGIIGMLPEVDPSTWDHRDEEMYGTGNVRPLSKFFDTFGIDVNAKKCQRHLCSFVQGGQMHRDFVKYLRSDGMGIDYSHISYKFIDPRPDDPN